MSCRPNWLAAVRYRAGRPDARRVALLRWLKAVALEFRPSNKAGQGGWVRAQPLAGVVVLDERNRSSNTNTTRRQGGWARGTAAVATLTGLLGFVVPFGGDVFGVLGGRRVGGRSA